MVATISPLATSGFSSASAYDTYRPSYPTEAVSSFLSALKVKGVEGARIIDLGAGTGKFTQILAEQEESYEILAIEPHSAMRSELVQKGLKRVQIKHGTAETMEVEHALADAVICAQVSLPKPTLFGTPQCAVKWYRWLPKLMACRHSIGMRERYERLQYSLVAIGLQLLLRSKRSTKRWCQEVHLA